jgi:hypothetical protein
MADKVEPRMSLADVSDKVLADIVRNGCYSKNTRFDEGTYLLVVAIPYGKEDSVDGLKEAIVAFREFLNEPDGDERQYQVLALDGGGLKSYEISLEQLDFGEDEQPAVSA